MDHFYENIDGWFNFEDLYREVVEKAKDGDRFVEIGAWKGRSTAFMAVEIINSGKKIELNVDDTFVGSEEHQKEESIINATLEDEFLKNTKPVADHYKLLIMQSVAASKLFPDHSLDFVFIDAAHGYEFVKEDIEAWLPKVKQGGLIAGDDYQTWPGVKQAVDELLPDAEKRGIYWMQRL